MSYSLPLSAHSVVNCIALWQIARQEHRTAISRAGSFLPLVGVKIYTLCLCLDNRKILNNEIYAKFYGRGIINLLQVGGWVRVVGCNRGLQPRQMARGDLLEMRWSKGCGRKWKAVKFQDKILKEK